MAQDIASSISGVKMRITRLNPDGTLMVGEENSYVTDAFISVSMTPEYSEGDEFEQKNAGGEVCAEYRTDDTLKQIALEIAICNPDHELTEMIAGGRVLADAEGNSIGYVAPPTGVAGNPDGVALEIWSRAVKKGRPDGGLPFFHWVLPYAKLREGGDRVIENDILATSFEGWAKSNDAFDRGPAAPFFPYIIDGPYGVVRSNAIPAGFGYAAVVAPTPTP